MADVEVDISRIPQDVKEQLHELELELSEGKNSKTFFPLSESDAKIMSSKSMEHHFMRTVVSKRNKGISF